jgi:rhodanese-related sulfurtransferase
MKTRIVLFTVIASLSVATLAAAQAMRNVPRISIDDVKALMAKKQVVLIDVRDPQSFAEGHMPGAINVPFDHLPKHVDAWKKEKRLLVTYCA